MSREVGFRVKTERFFGCAHKSIFLGGGEDSLTSGTDLILITLVTTGSVMMNLLKPA